jgi:sulfite oxidase
MSTTTKAEPLDYSQDPKRDLPALIVRKQAPFNAEPEPTDLVKNYITPEEYFFCLNHGPLPDIKEEQHTIHIQGIGCDKTTDFTLKQIKENYEKVSVMMVMQVCLLLCFRR